MKRLILSDDGKVEEVVPLCRELGIGIEIQAFSDPKLLTREPDAVERHRQAITGITLKSLHGCYGDLCPGSSDPMIREVTRNRFELSYYIAAQLQIKHIVFHHGYVPHTSLPSGWIRRSTEFWRSFLEEKDSSMHYHIENHNDAEPGLISDVVHSINNPQVDINLDIGHAHFASKKMSVTKWIEQLNSQIGYVHLHDNHGEEDEHLGLGQGTIPMKEVCRALNDYAPNAIWAIEADVRQSLDWLGENGFIDSALTAKVH